MATTITANGINFPDGSASAPSIGGTDTNTGLFTGSDIVGFATGGTERIRIDANGRLAIGINTAPRDMVHIHNPNANASSYIQFTNANTGGTGNNDGTLIGISQNNSNTDGTGSGFTILNKENAEITLGTNNAERLRITAAGKVGIGDSTPSVTLETVGHNQVTFGSMPETIISYGTTSAYNSGSAGSGIQFGGNYNTTPEHTIFAGVHGVKENTTNAHYGGALVFSTRANGGNSAERLRITSDGRLLLNTTSVANTDDALTIKRAAGSHSVTSLTVDSTTATGSYANALIFTKAKDYYYNGLIFESSTGHQGGVVAKMTAGGGTTPQIELRIGGTSLNQSDKSAITIYPSGNVSLPDGNLVVASGHGIDFSATSGSAGSSELLSDYEHGNWVPTSAQGGWTVSNTYSKYVKIGNLVHLQMYIGLSGTGNSNNLQIGGMPFAVGGNGYAVGTVDFGEGGIKGTYMRTMSSGSTLSFLYPSENTSNGRLNLAANQVGDSYVIATISYVVDGT